MSFSVSEVVHWTGGRLVNATELGSASERIRVDRPSPLPGAKNSDLAFFFSRYYERELPTARPGILITGEAFVKPLQAAGLPFWKTSAVIACADPYLAMAILSEKFAAELSSVAHLPGTAGPEPQIHPTAVVSKTAELGPGVQVGARCVIEDDVRVGAGSIFYAGCYVGPKCSIGENSVLFAGVSLYEWTQIGDRVRVHAGAVIGADGFGYAPRREGDRVVAHQKIYHLGRVVIEDDVEIGANTCVDRGTFGETRIGRAAKIDNLIQIGHNAQVGEGAILCGGTCLAGNSNVGKFAYVGGLTGVANQVQIGDGASVGAMTLVTKDVPARGTAVGNPQREYKEHFKAHALLSRLLAERKEKREK